MRRILGIALAVVLIGGVVAAVVAGRGGQGTNGTATKTVHGVIGSEKAEFFDDPDVVTALAAAGWKVQTETSGSWAMDRLPLKDYDFAFPSSQAPAEEIRAKSDLKTTPVRPFYSPLVVVAHSAAAKVLADNGLARMTGAKSGTLLMDPYLKGAAADRNWSQLKGAPAHAELSGSVFITTTDPSASNSGALYLALTSFVAEHRKVVSDAAGIDRTAPLLHKLVSAQGAQQTGTDAPFRDFISGVGNPLVLVYESQVASLLLQKQDTGDLVVLYPDTTVYSDHTLVPLTADGEALGKLLGTDKRLRELAVRHGFRPQGARAEFTSATKPYSDYLNQTLAGIGQAPVPTAGILRRMAQRARG
ncbi:substrate-binding domain-containing protein [Streptomyces sp. NRRL S-87]|uniref:substrate-binding domain-containing protein n=1 Tax=Streptomyces sp. NRRL S-87 TaxID=1463920 RepID=UPI0004C28197|nr:substrate-binding domain-containing protein [Streptomyces sp. NRRL S-87]